MENKLRKDLKRGYTNTLAKAYINLGYGNDIEKNMDIIAETQKKIDLLRKGVKKNELHR